MKLKTQIVFTLTVFLLIEQPLFAVKKIKRFDLSGVVVGADGEPVKKAVVTIAKLNKANLGFLRKTEVVAIGDDKTNRKGGFKFKNLPVGEYLLTATHDEYGKGELKVQLSRDQFVNYIRLETLKMELDRKESYRQASEERMFMLSLKKKQEELQRKGEAKENVAKQKSPELFLPKDEFETSAEYKQRQEKQNELLMKVERELIAEKEARKKEEERLAREKEAEYEREKQITIAESLVPVSLKIESIGEYDADNEIFNIVIIETALGYLSSGYVSPLAGDILDPYSFIARGSVPVFDSFPVTKNSVKIGFTKKDTLYTFSPGNYEPGNFLKIAFKSGSYKIQGSYKINIPRGEARNFKENYTSAKLEGYKQLTDNMGNHEYFNMVAIHPITGSRFPFGPRKDIATAPVIASKKSVVPPDLKMKVAFLEPNGNSFLDAEEKGRVKVSITNSGQGSAMGVFVKLDNETLNKNISVESSKIIGEIPAGHTKVTEFEVIASKSVVRMVNQFTVSATESYGFPPDPAQISFETFAFIPPKLELVDFGVSTPNERNEIRPQTTTEVQVRVQNRGQGPADNVKFSINLPKGVYFTPGSQREYSFSVLKPGEFKDLEFFFNTAKTVGKTIDVSIGFTEESTTGKFALNLEVEKPQQTIQQLVVKGQEMGITEFADVATISVDIEKDIPKSERKGKNDLAVVFGIESYKNVPGVSFAKRDAMWMKKYFEDILGIRSNRIYYKTDSDVTLAEFKVAFGGWIKKRLKKDSNIFIYYAGHGAPDIKHSKAYLIPYDGNPNYASDTGYEMDALYKDLGDLGAASVTVFLDACFSGANRNNEMLLADARPVYMEVDESAVGKVTVFSASGGKEISSAWPEKKHGLFSYYLMKGMRGDADANDDKQITVGELGDYIKENVSDMAGMLDREQTPMLQTMDRAKVLIQY